MTDFDAILQSSLSRINEGYDEASKDIARILEAITTSLRKTTTATFALNYSVQSESFKGDTIRVYFDFDPDDDDADMETIDHFFIPSKGYPIQQGTYRKQVDIFSPLTSFADRGAVERYFAEMLENPDSKLIQTIGFAMRKHKQDEDESLPF